MDKPTLFADRLRYRLDSFFAKGGMSIFLALLSLFGAAFLIMGGIRIGINLAYPDPSDVEFRNLGTIIWRTALQVVDVGSMAEDSQSAFYNKTLGILTSLFGLALISTMLAFVTSIFKEKLESLKKGKSAVLETDHTIILGFGIRAIEIIRELIEANASEKDGVVVILSEMDKEKMDDIISDYLTDTQTTRLVTRSGSTSNPLALEKIGVAQAKSIIVLNPAGPANPPEIKSKADYRVLKSVMAVVAAIDSHQTIPVVAKLHFPQNRALAGGKSLGHVIAIDEEQILSKILVQTSRNPGLTVVYSDLVGFIGNEVYFCPVPDQFLGLTFGEFAFYFKQSVPLGIEGPETGITLNPDPSTILQAGDEAIILAEDDSTIHFYPEPVITPCKLDYANERMKPLIEKYLIFGWSTKSPIVVDEYGCYLKSGSVIDIAVPKITTEIETQFLQIAERHPEIQMHIYQVDALSPEFPTQLSPESYDNVIIMAGQANDVEEIDSETITILLKFRHYFELLQDRTGRVVNTQVISEIMDSENVEIFQHTGVKDFVISNQFVSKLMAQISQDPRVNQVYDILFKAEGSEIYLKPLPLYLEQFPVSVTFADLMLAAQNRSEICFGVKLNTMNNSNDSTAYFIIPDKDTIFEMGLDDELIVLAVDET
jgi:ion channel POLLUX/CASTOR